jgi:2-haloacid dehalogenase
MPRVIVFDVNETLLDLAALDPIFAALFGEEAARREWFQQMLQSAMVATITDTYADFSTLAMAALEMVAARRNHRLTDGEREAVRNGMRQLPPHSDVVPALDRLSDAGLRLAALTNSTAAVAEAQLGNAGLRDRFEQVLSADTVQRLKPAPEPYRMAADRLAVEMSQIRLVAAHAWDVAGAMRAGCSAAFVARPGMVLDPLAPTPDIVGTDLIDVAQRIIAIESNDAESANRRPGAHSAG